ncbi:UNVERIFIED_CONTAM: hypothetical protein LK11_29970 [Mumia flava]
MPVYKVERYLRSAVDSVLGQSYRNLELVLVDDGSPDTCGDICDDYAASDSRVRVLHQPNGGLSNARNNGVKEATGELLTFIDSDDLLYDDAYRRQVSSLLTSGSDFVTGNVYRFDDQSSWQSWNQKLSHQADRTATSLAKHTTLLYDTVTWNKVYRRDFWDGADLSFPEGKLYEDIVPMFRAYRAAASVDVLRIPTYKWRVRSEQSSITQQKSDLRTITDKLEMMDVVYRELAGGSERDLLDIFFQRTLEGDLWTHVKHVRGIDHAFDEVVVRAARHYWGKAPDRVKRTLPQERRVHYRALCEGRPEMIPAIQRWYTENRDDLPVVRRRRKVFLDGAAVPEDWPSLAKIDRELTLEARPRVQINDGLWTDTDSLVLSGWAYLPFRRPADQRLSIWLENVETSRRAPLVVRRIPSPQAMATSSDPHHHLGDVGFEVEISYDVVAPLKKGRRPERWDLVVGITTESGEVVDRVRGVLRGGPLSALAPRIVGDDLQVAPVFAPGEDVGIELRRPRLIAERVDVEDRTLTVEARLTSPSDRKRLASDPVGTARLRESVLLCQEVSPVEVLGEDRVRARFEVPDPSPRAMWRLRMDLAGREGPVAWGNQVEPILPEQADGLAARPSANGWLLVEEAADAVTVTDARVGADLRVRFSVVALGSRSVELALCRVDDTNPQWHEPATHHGRPSVTFDLARTDAYGVRRPWSEGLYLLRARTIVRDAAGSVVAARPIPVAASASAMAAFRTISRQQAADVEVLRIAGQDVGVKITAPIPLEDRGGWARRQMLEHHGRRSVVRPEDAVFLRTDDGHRAADSALALQREIERRGLDLQVYWGVRDLSVPVPPGTTPVLDGSRAWYEKLARSRLVVNNSTSGMWEYPAHPHQTHVQTWHGTPFSLIGLAAARHEKESPTVLEEIREEAATWDLLLSSSPFCTKLFGEDLAFDGTILEVGSPRNDLLVSATGHDTARVRDALGIPGDRRVLLYAPTYRETLRVGWAAKRYDGLDLQRLAAALGPDWVVLHRGHPLNARAADRIGRSAQVVDVTDHPDVAPLVVAVDVVVTDYSSLMFDVPVTGKPLYFFTPDLADHLKTRPAYHDLAEIAPSALHVDVEELAGDVAEHATYHDRHGAAYAELRQRFAPWDDGKAAGRVLDAVLR